MTDADSDCRAVPFPSYTPDQTPGKDCLMIILTLPWQHLKHTPALLTNRSAQNCNGLPGHQNSRKAHTVWCWTLTLLTTYQPWQLSLFRPAFNDFKLLLGILHRHLSTSPGIFRGTSAVFGTNQFQLCFAQDISIKFGIRYTNHFRSLFPV